MCHLRDAYLGAPQIHAAPQAFLQDPLRWLDWMSAHRVANTWAPNFAFNLVCVEIAKRGRRDWDLSGLRLVLNGGEAVARGYAENFLRALAPCGLRPEAMRPVWGMSETASGSVICDRFHADMARGTTGPVSVGRPLPGNAIRIVDEHGVTVTEGVIGRLQTTGATVLDAYLDNPEANRRAFTADGWFDTGDLGVVTGGRLCLMGRNKDVIIVNGQNIDPGMVEAQIDGLPGVVPSFTAVVVRHDVQHSIDRVSVFFAPEPAAALEPLLQKIRGRLAGTFGIQVEEIVALPPGAVPKTSIGKIQKERLKAGLDSGQLQPAYRRPAEAKGAAGEEAKLPGIWRRVWRPRRLQTSPADLQLGVIADGAPVHARLAAALNSAGIAAVLLSADRIAEPDLVARHLVLVTEPGIPVATVLPVIQAAGRASGRRPVFLLVLAQASQAVLPHEIADPQRAMLVPLLRTAQQEYPNLNIRHVDCEGHPAATARIVAAECGDPAREPEVAYRAGERLVSRLAPAAASGGIALRAAGRYLLSGGLGGIGRHLAAHLLAMPEVRLVLLGRRAEAALDADARATLQRLRQAGAVEYVAADCGDGAALARLEPRIRDALGGRLDGVFHLAGTVTMAPLERLSAADLAGNLPAKVEGSRALQRLAARLEAEFLVHFGSLNGYFGGAEVGAYAVANRYQLAQSEAGLARGGPKLRCINWSMWDETGISRGYRFKELSQRLGYRTLAPEQALSVLEAALAAPHPVCFVGIDETVPRMHAETTARPLPLAEIEIAEAGDGTGLAAVTDAFGTPVAVTRSAAVAAESAAREAPACRTAVEDLVAQVWREVLELEQRPAPEDNLFDLGAQSLLMPRLQNRLAEALGIEIDILDLFEHCTLQTMADHLQRSVAAPSPAAAGR
jgi:hypothetical protein